MNDCTVLVHMHHGPWTVTAGGLFLADTLYLTHITTHTQLTPSHTQSQSGNLRLMGHGMNSVVTSCPEQDYRLCVSEEIRLHQRMDLYTVSWEILSPTEMCVCVCVSGFSLSGCV